MMITEFIRLAAVKKAADAVTKAAAATTIQARIRCYAVKVTIVAMQNPAKEYPVGAFKAALKIQACFRRHAATTKFRAHLKDLKVQAFWRRAVPKGFQAYPAAVTNILANSPLFAVATQVQAPFVRLRTITAATKEDDDVVVDDEDDDDDEDEKEGQKNHLSEAMHRLQTRLEEENRKKHRKAMQPVIKELSKVQARKH